MSRNVEIDDTLLLLENGTLSTQAQDPKSEEEYLGND